MTAPSPGMEQLENQVRQLPWQVSRMSHTSRKAILIAPMSVLLCSLVNCGQKSESAAQALAHGKDFFNKGDFRRAIEELRIASGNSSLAKEAHYWSGCAFEQLHDLHNAQNEFVTVALEDDHYGDVRMRLAKIQVRNLNPQEALWGGQWAEREIGETQDHGSADAYYVLGVRAVRQGHLDDAQKYLQRALSIDPTHRLAARALTIAALLNGDRKSPEDALLALPQSAQNAELIGEFYRLTGDLAHAEHWFREAVRQDNKLAAASVNLADTLWVAGKRQEALDVLSALNQTGANPYEYLHALAALTNGEFDQSSNELAALAKKPDFSPDAESRLVAAMIAAKRPDEAAKTVEARLGVAPADPRAIIDRVVLWMSGSGDLKDAKQGLHGLRARGVDSDLLHYLDGVLAIRRGPDFQPEDERGNPKGGAINLDAASELTQSVSINPAFLPARIMWEHMLVQQKNLPSAIEILDDTPLEQRRRPSAVLQRVWCFLALGNKPEAQRLLEASSLSLPVSLNSVTPAEAVDALKDTSQNNLRFDLIEYPQGPVFQETDMELLSFYSLNKGVVRWMAF